MSSKRRMTGNDLFIESELLTDMVSYDRIEIRHGSEREELLY